MNQIAKNIGHYFFKLKKHLITYSNGWYRASLVSNSPRIIKDNLAKFPMFNQSPNTIHSNSFLAIGFLHYYEIDKGLWNFINSTHHKKNTEYNIVFDPSHSKDYYILSCCIINENITKKGNFTLDNQEIKTLSWSLVKPGVTLQNKFPKGNTYTSYNLYFNKKWLKENIIDTDFEIKPELINFLNSNTNLYLTSRFDDYSTYMPTSITRSVIENNGNINNKLNFKLENFEIIQSFFKRNKEKSQESFDQNNISFYPEKDTIRMVNLLHSYLYKPFPGLEFIANELGMSKNSLSAKFKEDKGISVFQYFRSKQLQIAKQKLESEPVLVKTVANLFGYQSVSKFGAAFKNEFGFLPNEIKNQKNN